MKQQHVAIIGCGWVGQALVPALLAQQIRVSATTTNPAKLEQLAKLGCQPKLLSLPLTSNQALSSRQGTLASDDGCSAGGDEALEWLEGVDTMVISITPKFKHGSMAYPDHVASLVKLANQYQIGRVVLLSSTGIYQGLSGTVDEQSRLMLGEPKVALLHQAEQAVLSGVNRACVLRLAGLVGPKRHPARFMAGKEGVGNAQTPVNLVHQLDVVGAILAMLTEHQRHGIYNVVSETHPTRAEFYQLACRQLGLTAPQFTDQQEPQLRVVAGKKYQQLGGQLRWPDLLTWLESA
ncbi:hypothetical protein DXX93_01075 [Thalassotalea euphylliae]|uniref:Uncharacterized protein n=1 Tax=Thalassotalea euphylliae TaxID=1655234 RepID=A0A3E0TL92_9GAMM|nr:NAD(P)H-binding protein [Thalassotalea euphylliae]REL25286.1 hypothetical protein DXX93_01075 [Thalassotalea euphylliae]